MNAKELHELGLSLFSKRSTLMMLWQEIAENFYPERADFTFRRTIGTEYADNLYSSYPLICRRELGDQLGTMLRPTAKVWAKMGMRDDDMEDNDARRWMEWATGLMRRAMYDPVTQFTRAAKEGDHDFATFGQAGLSARMNRYGDALLYRCFHLRDLAWAENEEGRIGMVFRKWKPTARDLVRLFGASKLHPDISRALSEGHPLTEYECMHFVVEADLYSEKANGKPYWSITYDSTHDSIIAAVAVWDMEYVIPRWQTVSGSQYAFSPATTVGLAEARLLQAMSYTLLEAGEKVVNPPMVAVIDAVRSDMAVYAGGETWIDRDYDERTGEALRPMNIDAKGMPLGVNMQDRSQQMLAAAFFLNKLKPFTPSQDPQMTAFQAGQIVAQYIRDAIPLFEPMEMSYNGGICDLTFGILLRNGAFGPPQNMPRSIRQAIATGQMMFRFESPLHDAIEAQKGNQFLQMKQLITEAMSLDRTAVALPDIITALREALEGVGVPASWIRSETTVQQIKQADEAAQQSQAQLAAAQQSSEVVANLAGAQKDAAQAQAQAVPA